MTTHMQTNREALLGLGEPKFLLVKRGLYYRPQNSGYTGIKENAGRYHECEADGVEIRVIHEDDAPLYAPGTFRDLAAAHFVEKVRKLSAGEHSLELIAHAEALADLLAGIPTSERAALKARAQKEPDHG